MLAVAALIAGAAIAAPGMAQAQNQAPAADVDRGTLTLNTSRFQVKVEWNVKLGVTTAPRPPAGNDPSSFYYFSDENFRLVAKVLGQSQCFEDPLFRILCPKPPVKRIVIKLGPLNDNLKIRAEVPKLPKMPSIEAGRGDDSIRGGRNGEAIDLGKGEDKVKSGEAPTGSTAATASGTW
jgi:hypothetical protein